jgi:hypothetical protein
MEEVDDFHDLVVTSYSSESAESISTCREIVPVILNEYKSEAREIVEIEQAAQEQMWAMQPPQPYAPHASPNVPNEEEIPINLGRAKIKTPYGGTTHFNVFLNQTPHQPPQQQPQYMNQQPNMGIPPPCYGGYSQSPMYNQAYTTPPPHQMYGQPMYNGYPPYGMPQQQPQVVYMNQQPPKPPTPPPEKPKEKTPEKKPEPRPPTPPIRINPPMAPTPPPPPPPKPVNDKLSPICVASIIIAVIASMLGVASIVKTNEAYDAHVVYKVEGNGNESSVLFEDWQMARNVALGAGASCACIFSLAFLFVFWSGMRHKLKRKVVSGCCMTMSLIGAWIVFAFTFVVDVVVLVLAFDDDNVVYPAIVWAAFIGHNVSWLLMLVNSETARRWVPSDD